MTQAQSLKENKKDVLKNIEKVEGEAQIGVFVYDAPLRIWHWLNAILVFILIGTGIYIAQPFGTAAGEAYDNYLMGYVRFTHFASGLILAVLFLWRLYGAIFGSVYARQIFTLPFYRKKFLLGLFDEIKHYWFLKDRPQRWLAHNPMAHFSMFISIILIFVMIVTGLGLYAEGKGAGTLFFMLFGWITHIFGNTFILHTIHHWTMWGIIIFVIIHIYAATRDEIMSGQTAYSSMVSGWRVFRQDGYYSELEIEDMDLAYTDAHKKGILTEEETDYAQNLEKEDDDTSQEKQEDKG
ncbi:MAG: Ni/Fe-hydrogenase, b-type cytochrome subunit [Alphaproteobacteria bacterium]